jgi:hypothetical protein
MVAPQGATIVPAHSGTGNLLVFRNARGIHVEGFHVKQPDGVASRVLIYAVEGENVLKNWRLSGWQDQDWHGAIVECRGTDTVVTLENVQFPDGGNGTGTWIRPTLKGDFPSIGEVPDLAPAGTINFINCNMEQWGEGLYGSPHSGKVNVIGGLYRNNDLANVRVGAHSLVKDVTVMQDDANARPRGSDGPSSHPQWRQTRGIWMEEGYECVVDNCDIIWNEAPVTMGGIVLGRKAGQMTVKNTRISVNIDGAPAIQGRSPSEFLTFHAPSMDRPARSHKLILENVSVTGSASGDSAIRVYDRDGSSFRNMCVQQDGSGRNGIEFVRTNGTLDGATINVTGEATLFRNCNVDTSGITQSGSCPVPKADGRSSDYRPTLGNTLEISGRSNYKFSVSGKLAKSDAEGKAVEDADAIRTIASGNVGEGSVDGDVDAYNFDGELTGLEVDGDAEIKLNGQVVQPEDYGPVVPNTISIVGEGGLASYEFTVSGSLKPSTARGGSFNSEDNIRGSSAEGAVAGGVDSYAFSGELTDFRFTEGSATVYLNDKQIDPATVHLTNTVSIVGDSGLASYEFTVDGEVQPSTARGGSFNSEDNIMGSTVEGAVAGGVDSYAFSGAITDFRFAQGSASVYLNDQKVDPSSLGSDDPNGDQSGGDAGGSTGDGSGGSSDSPTDQPETHLLVVHGNKGKCSYEFTASGAVEKTTDGDATIDSSDSVDGSSVSGSVWGGRDAYRVEGSITEFRFVDGEATLYLDGEAVDPASLGSDGSNDGGSDVTELPHLLVIDGVNAGESSYSFSVTGSIKKTTEGGATVDETDRIEGSSASGTVWGGRDAYRFSGAITRFQLDGSGTVNLNRDA